MEQYSLWLRPEQKQINELTEIVSDLAHRYRTQPFPPHITLLSRIPADIDTIKQACKKIVEQTQVFEIPLWKIDYTEAYYRNFFILAEHTSSLINVHECAKKLLNFTSDEEFIPHVSLLYGKLDIETKKSLKEQLEDTYPRILNCNRLDFYNSSGNESDWHVVESYYFTDLKK